MSNLREAAEKLIAKSSVTAGVTTLCRLCHCNDGRHSDGCEIPNLRAALAEPDKSLEDRCFEQAQQMIRVANAARDEQREVDAKIALTFFVPGASAIAQAIRRKV